MSDWTHRFPLRNSASNQRIASLAPAISFFNMSRWSITRNQSNSDNITIYTSAETSVNYSRPTAEGNHPSMGNCKSLPKKTVNAEVSSVFISVSQYSINVFMYVFYYQNLTKTVLSITETCSRFGAPLQTPFRDFALNSLTKDSARGPCWGTSVP